MRKKTKIIFIIIVIGFGFISCIMSITHYLKNRSSEQLSMILKGLEVGLPLSEVEKRLGQPMRVLTKEKDVEEWGTVKDKKIIKNCGLYMFPYWGMPHKYILVYVNKDSNEISVVDTMPM